ncbi:hypothetical protein KY308_03965 [Candidatus Woesearchaeota archaeon]|nr:hypothetical protein [Candidatus Woesearchaeota archaeon]
MVVETASHPYQRIGLNGIVKTGVFRHTDNFFPLTSGKITNYYFECANMLRDGGMYSSIVSCLTKMIKSAFPDVDSLENYNQYIISGGESKDWIFSLPIAKAFEIPHAMVYKNGTVKGADIEGRDVIHILDINNQGSSIKDKWIPAIKNAGGNLVQIVSFIDTLEGGFDVVKGLVENKGVDYATMVPMDKFAWEYLRENVPVPDDAHNLIMERRKDSESWARKMLLSDKGLENLAAMLVDEDLKLSQKAVKVIEEGYSDMKPELKRKLLKEHGIDISGNYSHPKITKHDRPDCFKLPAQNPNI